MTQEEKAKSYDEALKKMKAWVKWVKGEHPECFTEAQKTAEFIFPELKESEDERIRKAIMEFFELQDDNTTYSFIPKKDILTWLEKQGKLNPYSMKETTWNKEDEENMNNVLYILNQLKDTSSYEEDNIGKKTINWFKSLKYRLCSSNEYDKDMLGAIIYCIKNNRQLEKEHIAWLEKQGEKPQGKSALEAAKEEKVDNQNCVKPDKNEPEIHEGDWVVYNHDICQIVKREEGCNKLVTVFGIEKELVNERNLSTAHLWTIQDAKDGDVLVDKSDGTIGIFQSIGHHPDGGSYNDHSYCFLHCHYDDGFFYADFEHGNTMDSDDAIPATKEQRDLLFQKMAEAGYEWNASKKELKKIEQKSTNNPEPKFYEEDWIMIVIDDNPCQIINIDNRGNYIVQYCNDEETHVLSKNFCESHYHLWTIEDAKDGDVLVGKIDGDDYILIFKQIKDGWIETYGHYYGCVDRFCVPSQLFCRDYKGTFYPANKKLRDFLFSKMKEAGYELDADKKELKIVDWSKHIKYNPNATSITEEKPAWTEEDTKKLYDILSIFGGGENCFYNSPILIDWLKSLKERIGG